MKLSCSRSRRRGMTLADALIVVALIPLVLAILAGCYRHRTGCSNRVKCASNLRQIGQAILMYSNDERGPYPRTVYAPGPSTTPTWGTGATASNPFKEGGPAPNDVSAALFLLLRTQDITAEVFVCPCSFQEKWDFGGGAKTALDWSNWNGAKGIAKHLSYSYANPYPDDAAANAKPPYKLNNSLSAEFAVAADMNPGPGAGDGKSGVLAVTSTSSAKHLRQANSRNHDRDGQNVLYGDGHVEFQSNPFCGVNRDNIYARRAGASGLTSSAIVASPYDASDSVLLPCE